MEVGDRSGKLLLTSYVGLTPKRKRVWVAICDCGNETVVVQGNEAKSCGCLKAEVNTARNKAMATHRQSRSREHISWSAMRERCLNQRSKDYHKYGGRGISICASWASFENFLADMGTRPKGMSLERIDVNGNYEPDNCKWADAKEQANNRRNTKNITFNGETKCAADWAKDMNLTPCAMYQRIRKWGIEKALTQPRTKIWRELPKGL